MTIFGNLDFRVTILCTIFSLAHSQVTMRVTIFRNGDGLLLVRRGSPGADSR